MTRAPVVVASTPVRYKVMARVEDYEHANGQSGFRWVCVRGDVPRGTGEALASQVARDGFRLDSERGSVFYPAHRIALVEVIDDETEVT